MERNPVAPAELVSAEPVILHYFKRPLRKPTAGLVPVEAMILHYEPAAASEFGGKSSLHRDELGGGGEPAAAVVPN